MNRKDRDAARRLYALTRNLDAKKASAAIAAFVALLTEHGQLARGPKILEALEAAAVEAEGGMEAELAAAAPMKDAAVRKLTKELSKAIGAPVLLRTKTDPSLIGGAVIRAGDLMIDVSVKGRLDRLRKRLTSDN